MMKQTEKMDHGIQWEPGFRFTVKDLAYFTRGLKPGQTVVTKQTVEREDGKMIISHKTATVVAVYPHVTVVDQTVIVKNCSRAKKVTKRTSYTNKELMIWNMGENQ